MLTFSTAGFLMLNYKCRNIPIADEEKKNTQIRHACWDSRGPPVLSAQCPRDTAIHVTRAGLKMANHAGRYDKCLYQ